MASKKLALMIILVLAVGFMGCSESDESGNGSGAKVESSNDSEDVADIVYYTVDTIDLGEETEDGMQLEWTVDQIKAIDNSYDYMMARVAVYVEKLGVLYKIKDQETADRYAEELREVCRKDHEVNKTASKYGKFSAEGAEANKYMILLRQASDLSNRISAERGRIKISDIDIPDGVRTGKD